MMLAAGMGSSMGAPKPAIAGRGQARPVEKRGSDEAGSAALPVAAFADAKLAR